MQRVSWPQQKCESASWVYLKKTELCLFTEVWKLLEAGWPSETVYSLAQLQSMFGLSLLQRRLNKQRKWVLFQTMASACCSDRLWSNNKETAWLTAGTTLATVQSRLSLQLFIKAQTDVSLFVGCECRFITRITSQSRRASLRTSWSLRGITQTSHRRVLSSSSESNMNT